MQRNRSDRRASQRGARYKLSTTKLPVQFVHITHILVDARLVSRFSRIPPAIFSWVTARERDSCSRVQVLAALSLYLLHPNLMCGLILRSRDRVMLIATYKNDGSPFFFIIAFRLLLNAYIFSAIKIERIIHQCLQIMCNSLTLNTLLLNVLFFLFTIRSSL